MKMVDAAVAIRDGRASGMARECWDPSMSVIPGRAQSDGTRFLYLWNSTKQVAYEWFPHSIDVDAEDWLVRFATT